MILSILDTDLYKFSMSYAYFCLYPLAEGTFRFTDRNKEDWSGDEKILEDFKLEFAHLSNIKLVKEEKEWAIRTIPYIHANYWEWLGTFQYDLSKMKFWIDEEGVFQCEVTDVMYKATLYEIPVLYTLAALRNKRKAQASRDRIIETLDKKIEFANQNGIPFSEFGTRRRFSSAVHEEVVKRIKLHSFTCVGTSNVHFAMKYGMVPQGTVAHEFIMFHAAVFGYKRANWLSLENWIKVYDGALGTALIDTYTTDSFLRTLTRKHALLLPSFRQDSGDEFLIGNKIIARLKEFGIDPQSKAVIFSNSLNMDKAKDIMEYFRTRIKVGFGIGTDLTCDLGDPSWKAPNYVMKLWRCRMSPKDPWEYGLKISDDQGKFMGPEEEYKIACYELHLSR